MAHLLTHAAAHSKPTLTCMQQPECVLQLQVLAQLLVMLHLLKALIVDAGTPVQHWAREMAKTNSMVVKFCIGLEASCVCLKTLYTLLKSHALVIIEQRIVETSFI